MLKMPALIREWKAVCLTARYDQFRIVANHSAGRQEELDQMAQIRSRVMMGLFLVMYKDVSEQHLRRVILWAQKFQQNPSICICWMCDRL